MNIDPNSSAKYLVIMRGLPGSGKSTLAKGLIEKFRAAGRTAVVRSTDDQFLVEGRYVFDPRRIGPAHQANQNLVKDDLRYLVDLVVVDNTSIRLWESEPYRQMAQEAGYLVADCVVGTFDEPFVEVCARRNSHGVPLEAIRRMARSFEQ